MVQRTLCIRVIEQRHAARTNQTAEDRRVSGKLRTCACRERTEIANENGFLSNTWHVCARELVCVLACLFVLVGARVCDDDGDCDVVFALQSAMRFV